MESSSPPHDVGLARPAAEQSGPSAAPAPTGRARRILAVAVTGPAVLVAAALYLLVSPLIALATGLVRIVLEIRDTAVRPRPFVGARPGLPGRDRPSPAPDASGPEDGAPD